MTTPEDHQRRHAKRVVLVQARVVAYSVERLHKAIKAMRDNDFTLREIASVAGVSHETVREIVKKT